MTLVCLLTQTLGAVLNMRENTLVSIRIKYLNICEIILSPISTTDIIRKGKAKARKKVNGGGWKEDDDDFDWIII